MRMRKLLNKFCMTAVALLATVQLGMVSCSDDPGIDNYYTSKKEYAIDYLKNRSQYSEYLEILKRATGERNDLRFHDLLATYGSYTVFAPTNDAVKLFLNSKGYKSVDELSKEECDTIALNSIIEMAFFTTDYSNDVYPKANMLEHTMRIDSLTTYDQYGEPQLRLLINKDATLIHYDDSVCNGVVHTVDRVVCTSNDLLPMLLEKDTTISMYYEALALTHITDSISKYLDESYGFAKERDRIDSCTWTNDKLCIFTAAEYDNVAYPEKRYFNYTAFMVKDEVLKEKGITKVKGKDDPSSLEYKAHEIYDAVYPEDADVDDYTDRRNALNRFISYHILDRYGLYYTLTVYDNHRIYNNFDRKHMDLSDWYPTLMPNSLMKFSYPSIYSNPGLYINRRGRQSKADARGVFVRGSYVSKTLPANAMATNGIYYYIDDIVDYGVKTQTVVLDERMRFDCSTLSPDFMTKLTDGDFARGHKTLHSDKYYGDAYHGTDATGNKNTCIGFKAGYVRRFNYTDNTHLHVRNRYLWFWSYEGDEVTIKGAFDVRITLPPVPAGTYEIRMFTCVDFASRGILQSYIDDEPQGIPFDMRPGGVALYGFKSDSDLGDEDAILAFDKSAHNRGWMKGPGCYISGPRDTPMSASDIGSSFRNQASTLRRVLGTFTTDGKHEHVLRLQQKMETGGELNFDFIELCPASVYNNPYYTEDIY